MKEPWRGGWEGGHRDRTWFDWVIYNVYISPLKWLLHGQKREYTCIIKILNSIIYMCYNLSN